MLLRKLIRRRKPVLRNFMATHDPAFPKPGQRIRFSAELEHGAEFGRGCYRAEPARIEQDLTGLCFLQNPIRIIPWRRVLNWFTDTPIKRRQTRKAKVQK
mgnify:CR=1 FL=1